VVAIDGPSASGKSTVSKASAKALGFIYVDSGAIYRGVTWAALQSGVDVHDHAAVVESLKKSAWAFRVENGAAVFAIDGVTPVDELRSKAVRENVSEVASIPAVRDFIVENLRKQAELGSIVMEGRDITTVVFPDTPFKFYLDADPEERAMRRYRELVAKGEDEKAHEVLESLKKRDEKDANRQTAPLQVAEDATIINSTSMGIEEVVGTVLKQVRGAKDEA
jgi:cytidylate kinase